MSDPDDDDWRVAQEDRLREKAPASDMWGPIAWVEGVPRFVRERYRTGGAPTKPLAAERPQTNAAQDADTSRAA